MQSTTHPFCSTLWKPRLQARRHRFQAWRESGRVRRLSETAAMWCNTQLCEELKSLRLLNVHGTILAQWTGVHTFLPPETSGHVWWSRRAQPQSLRLCRLCLCRLCLCRLCLFRLCLCRLCLCRLFLCRLCICRLCLCRLCLCASVSCAVVGCAGRACRLWLYAAWLLQWVKLEHLVTPECGTTFL